MLNEIEILKNMEYVRTGGSSKEEKCAKYIVSLLKDIGIKGQIEEFKVQDAKIEKCSLKITKPYNKTIECLAYKNGSNANNLKKELFYLRNTNSKAELSKVKDKIVLIDKLGIPYWTFKDLLEYGAAGFITLYGKLQYEDNDIDQKELRGSLRELGSLPACSVNVKDFYEMVRQGATEAVLDIKQEEIKTTKSRNVVANIKGEDDRTIIFTAHYDSTPLSKGIYDNATGSVGILKLCEYFKQNKPKHNLIFVWCGSEERGLLGSKAYCIKHKKSLDKIDLCINLDMIGSNLGHFIACITGEEKLVNYLEYFGRINGYGIDAYQGVYSSDSTPFADNGIPAVSFARITEHEPIHVRYDDMKTINEVVIKKDIETILEFSKLMANADIIPVNRIIPDNMKEKLDYYLFRKREKELV